MRFLIVMLLIVVGVVGLGFYRGWFHVSSDRSADKSNVTLTIDKDKAKQDAKDAKEKVHSAGDRADDRAGAAVDAAPVDKK
jgi:hypothetical protein